MFLSSEEIQGLYGGYPARIGYVVKQTSETWVAEEVGDSGHWANTFPELPNVYRVDGKVFQDHGEAGHIVYRLEDNNDDFINPQRACQQWYEVSNIMLGLQST